MHLHKYGTYVTGWDCSGPYNDDDLYELGGRTVFLSLELGDTVELFCDHCEATISEVTFCVALMP